MTHHARKTSNSSSQKGFPFIFLTNFPREIELRLEKHGTLSRGSSSVIQERELFNEPSPNPIFRTETLLNKVFTHTAGDLQAVLSSSYPLQTSVKSHPWNVYWWSCDVQICSSGERWPFRRNNLTSDEIKSLFPGIDNSCLRKVRIFDEEAISLRWTILTICK